MNRLSRTSLVAPVIFAILIAGTLAAIVVAEESRRNGLLLDRLGVTRPFTPNGDGQNDVVRIRFRLTRPSEVDLEVRTDDGAVARTLLSGQDVRDHVSQSVLWDGRDDEGALMPPGRYRLRFALAFEDREITPSETIDLLEEDPAEGASP